MPLDECPECHADLKEATAEEILSHRADHWPEEIPFPRVNTEAIARATALEDAADEKRQTEKRGDASRTLRGGKAD